MNVTDTRTRIAVFIDFDNVEIGVKSTIGGTFDIGLVLEAIKERGEIVTKIAYSDWKRAGDYSRLLTQHAIRMVQRNLTPGGDKNGADITMALDALEMAFTHAHINTFVIVGGDSDFISLVEKLKQYGRKVIVVGGRQFTSMTMQRNCHEFIAYENLVSTNRPKQTERGGKQTATGDISKALPLVRRALKVLTEREVTPQLGLLKSTLLQLDSTFSERDYGAGSFRDFMEKVAEAGAVTLRHAGRSMLVEPLDGGAPIESSLEGAAEPAAVESVAPEDAPKPREREDGERPRERAEGERPRDDRRGRPQPEAAPAVAPEVQAEGIRLVRQALGGATRWPMYIRQAKQFLKSAIEGFDERKYGFASIVDMLRVAGKDNVLRIERDRQGAIRVFPGNSLQQRAASSSIEGLPVIDPALEAEAVDAAVAAIDATILGHAARDFEREEQSVADGDLVSSSRDADEDYDDVNGNIGGPSVGADETPGADLDDADGGAQAEEPPSSAARGRKRKTVARKAAREPKPRAAAKTAKPRARKTAK